MFVKYEVRKNSERGRGKRPETNLLVFTCDQPGCGKTFEKEGKGKTIEAYKSRDFHFCSNDCVNRSQAKGGILEVRREQDCLKTLGVSHPMRTEETKKNFKKGMMTAHDVEHPSSSPKLIENRSKNYRKKTGYDYPMQNPEVMEKSKETCREAYGTDHAISSPEIREKIDTTMLERYGVLNSFQVESVKETSKRTLMKNYGVDHPSKSPVIRQRVFDTTKKNGTYGKSKAEDRCFEFLKEIFGESEVFRQQLYKKSCYRPIDFWIRSTDEYLQVDGVYWHGLDRPFEEIERLKNRRDHHIVKVIAKDKEQNLWFKENGKILLRITDLEVCDCPDVSSFKSLLDAKRRCE